MSNKNIVTGQLASITAYDPVTSQVEGVVTDSVTANTVSLGTGNLTLSGNVISSTADTITIDPLGDGGFTGNLVVTANMQVTGTLTYNNIINATTNDLQWIAANDAASTSLAAGAGLAVGPLGAYAQFTYNSAANVWQSSLPLLSNGGVNANGALSGATTGSFSGNITAPFFIGNGSQLTGLPAGYTNSNVATYLASNANVVITTTGNITTTANISGGRITATGNVSGGNITTGGTITATGNITGNYFIGNGSQLTGLPSGYANANVATYLASNANVVITTTGNITTTANIAGGTITATGNITANNIGNAAAINLNGNASSYLNGAGAWVTPPGGLRNITKVDQTYGYGTAFILADGRLFIAKGNGSGSNGWCSGLNPNDQSVALQAGINNMYELPFVEEVVGTIVDAGQYGPSAYALFANGNLYTWGYNGYGQLGIGSTTDSRLPILSNTGVAQVYVTKAQNHNYGVQRIVIRKTNNTYWGCGHDAQYQFGLGTNNSKLSWTALPWIPTDALSVWVLGGDLGSMFVQRADGSILVTGYNGYGQLGINSITQPTTPQNAPLWLAGDFQMRIQNICFGGSYQTESGTSTFTNITVLLASAQPATEPILLSAGSNNWGTLGRGNTTDSRVPVAPTGITGRIAKIASTGNAPRTMYALLENGTLYSWGYNSFGAVGNGTFTTPITSPIVMAVNVLDILGSVQGWDYIGFYSPSPFVKKADGYYSCGYNEYGNLGDGTVDNKNVLTKLRLPKNTSIKFFATYGNNQGLGRLGITEQNTIYAWGYNSQGQIDPIQTSWQAVVPLQFTPNALRA